MGRPKGYRLSQDTRDRMSASALQRHSQERRQKEFFRRINAAVEDGNRNLAHEILDEYIGEYEEPCLDQ